MLKIGNLTRGYLSALLMNIPVLQYLSALLIKKLIGAIKFNNWFLICYESNYGCVQCHIEALCLNEYARECLNLWMRSSVSTITNSSLVAWVDFGDRYPFLEWSELRIKVIDQVRGETVGFFTKKNIVSILFIINSVA